MKSLKGDVGPIRGTVAKAGTILSSQDYFAYGELIPGRSYNAGSANDKYKYTGKERDVESGYDYFGARYYDARIARWLSVDPLAEKYPHKSPYNYVSNNPMNVLDPDGRAEFTVTVRTYIPYANVGPLLGDNRGPMATGGTHRTQQVSTVETSPQVRRDADAMISTDSDISNSHLLVPAGGVGVGIMSGENFGSFSSEASRTDANGGDNATINMVGSAGTSLIPGAPAIDYNFNVTIVPGADGSVHVSVSGAHDGFPAYEVYVTPKGGKSTQVYGHTPKGKADFRLLFPPKDKTVNNVQTEMNLEKEDQ